MSNSIPSRCHVCLQGCPIEIELEDEIPSKVKPLSPSKNDGICGKGQSGIATLYDPNRLNQPLQRTNSKGIGVDPDWKSISWDQALATISSELTTRMDTNPEQVFVYHGLPHLYHSKYAAKALTAAIGTPHIFGSGGHHCGNADHFYGETHGTFITSPDYWEAEYILVLGCGLGNATSDMGPYQMQLLAEAKERGAKVVNVDPVGGPGADAADEWVPIRPGTDGAFLLGVAHTLLEEEGAIDRAYLREETNAPYLVGSDGRYVRIGPDNKPAVWDSRTNEVKPWDGKYNRCALQGEFDVDGEVCRTAFTTVRDVIREWTPERAAEVSSVPASTIRRIGREYATNAHIGTTVERDGHELRYRPVSVVAYKGVNAHDNANGAFQAVFLLNELVGATGAVGGKFAGGGVSRGNGNHFEWTTEPSADGVYEIPGQRDASGINPNLGFPVPEPDHPKSYVLSELNSIPIGRRLELSTFRDPAAFGLDPSVAENPFLLAVGGDPLHAAAEPTATFDAFADGFVVATNIYRDDSIDAIADIVLPAASYLERYSLPFAQYEMEWVCRRNGRPTWSHTIQQPATEPLHERQSDADILASIADEIGRRPAFNRGLNAQLFDGGCEHALEPDRLYSWRDVVDRWCQCTYDRDLAWFEENGFVEWEIDMDEYYWTQFSEGRTHVYWEHWVRWRDRIEDIASTLDVDFPDPEDFQPTPYWKPCRRSRTADDEFDLAAVYFAHPLQAGSHTYQNPVINDIYEKAPSAGVALINPQTADEYGIEDGASIEITAKHGASITTIAHRSPFVHPEVVGISTGKSLRDDRGVDRPGRGTDGSQQYAFLVEHNLEGIDSALFSEESDVPVRVRPIEHTSGAGSRASGGGNRP